MIETTDQLIEHLQRFPAGSRVMVRVDVNMCVDIEGTSRDTMWDDATYSFRPCAIIDLPTPDISTVPPLRVVRNQDDE